MPRLFDHLGRPIEPARLVQEESGPTLTGVRTILSDHPSRGLTPQKLAAILREAEEGDPTRYFQLAEDMEEKDLNYLAQLNTRKRAIAQLGITVEAASDSAVDVACADRIREFLRRDDVEDTMLDILDAIGKGIAVCEILWETSAREWMPVDLVWREPSWFVFDPAGGQRLLLREGAELRELTPFKYITHIHKAKSGVPIRGGLARAAAWAYLFKNYALKDWVAFAELFGQPYRVGTYHASATADDKARLLRAVADIGSDAAAIIPQGMQIDFKEVSRTGSTDLYERLCAMLDGQVTKAVLGQTLTSDVGSGGGSRALGEVHNEVRRDIMRSDARQLAATINRCLVRPIIDLNHGPQRQYPRVLIGLPDELSTMQKLVGLRIAVPMGLRVETSAVRDLLGFPEPAADAEVLQPPKTPAEQPALQAVLMPRVPAHQAAHAARQRDAVDEARIDELGDDGWRAVLGPLVEPVADLLDEVTTLREFRDRLPELIDRMDDEQLQEMLAGGGFAAYLTGAVGLGLNGKTTGEP